MPTYYAFTADEFNELRESLENIRDEAEAVGNDSITMTAEGQLDVLERVEMENVREEGWQ